MTTAVLTPPRSRHTRPADGGAPARRAVVRWAWRLFRREWRQQFLILALITVAVAATIVGSAVATNNPPPKNAGFGTAQDSASFTTYDAHTASVIAELGAPLRPRRGDRERDPVDPGLDQHLFSSVPRTRTVPSAVRCSRSSPDTIPSGADQVAVTSGVASAFHLTVGATWRVGGVERQVVGIVENPQSLLDEFALVVPGQVAHPTNGHRALRRPGARRPAHSARATRCRHPPRSPSRTRSTPRRSRSPHSCSACCSSRSSRSVASRCSRSGACVRSGCSSRPGPRTATSVSSSAPTARSSVSSVPSSASSSGLVVWLAYRPSLEQSSHHVIGVLALSWTVVIAAMVLAVVAAYFAASRPARAITKVPIVQALSGRPAPPRQIHRSALPGIVFLVLAFLLLGYSGGTNHGNGSGGSPELVFGIVLLIPGLILLAPFFLSLTARLGRRAPIAPRLALRDLARYRARSGSALAAISLGVLVAVIVMLAASARYGNVLDYAGPNLASNQLALHVSTPPPTGTRSCIAMPNGQLVPVTSQPAPRRPAPAQLAASAGRIAKGLGAQLIPLETPNAQIERDQAWVGSGTARSTWRPRSCCGRSGSRPPRSTRTRTS